MSEPNRSAPQGDEAPAEEAGESLQFDQAEFATPAGDGPACTVCHQPIAEEYYELGGKVFCAGCRQGVETAFRGGSRFARVLKALVLGSLAATVGAVIYYAIIKMTGWNIGLVAIVVGVMVGTAVRRGSGNRGGLGYQFLALFLTYSAIVAMHVPDLLEAIAQTVEKDQANKPKPAKVLVEKRDRDRAKAKGNEPAVDEAGKARKAETKPSEAPPASARALGAVNDTKERPLPKDTDVVEVLPEADAPPSLDLSMALMALVFLIALAYTIPVIVVFSQPISGVIFGFALWEAWKLNRRFILAFNGPFRLGTVGSDDARSPEVIDDGP